MRPPADITLDELEIGPRAKSALDRNNCRTVADILMIGKFGLTATCGCGPITIREISSAINRHGFKL